MGFRVIKTAIATLIAIIIADAFNIQGALSAGLLAILGVDVTRKRSLLTVSSRFFASVLGLLLAFGLFFMLGFHIWVLVLYILIAFPLMSRAQFKEGIVTSSVVVFRVFGGEELSLQVMLTQIELLLIGLGSAMAVNLIYMPNEQHKLSDIRHKIDELFAEIFSHIALTLYHPQHVWDGRELIEAAALIKDGLARAERALENQLVSPDESWSVYFYMRKQQLERIESMLELIAQVFQRMPQTDIAALLFERLSLDVTKEEYTGRTEAMLAEWEQEFKKMELPSTREEFEIRSAVLQICRELAMYLEIAKKDKVPTFSKT
ncbi:aromatic acid exporter family protein [Paenibacillus woosongensis]|uniref:Aromatic acid exporter family protein n=1 Tax=Paenibacillus woosongensis TaxID=307580 RepID=A0AA95HYJ3_9BACL|nr:aromatic acid exporter family protein [Paenibacillus woosongensis]WHX47189.1 aromatic acid exporter family protein [Paenibacillus woosongensis]